MANIFDVDFYQRPRRHPRRVPARRPRSSSSPRTCRPPTAEPAEPTGDAAAPASGRARGHLVPGLAPPPRPGATDVRARRPAASATRWPAPMPGGQPANRRAPPRRVAPWAPTPGGQDHPTQLGQVELGGRQGGARPPPRPCPADARPPWLSSAMSASSMSSTDGPGARRRSRACWRRAALGVGAADHHDDPPTVGGGQVEHRLQGAEPQVGHGGDGVGAPAGCPGRARPRRRPPWWCRCRPAWRRR